MGPRGPWRIRVVEKGPVGKLSLEDGGVGGVPVVLIPALAGTIRQWRSQADHVRRHRRAIIVQPRVHGNFECSLYRVWSP
jgi:hypothetical protein